MAERVLIVDDDPVQRRLIENLLQRFGYEATPADGGEAALDLILGTDPPRIDAVILDLMMPGIDGLAVLERLREATSTIPVIVQTAHGGIDNVVSAMRAGAIDFVVKPFGPERLQVSLRNAIATRTLESELARLKHSRAGTLTFKDIITRSVKLKGVLRTAEKAAASAIPVLLEGESGVGKELIARAIHGSSERRSRPFVAVNCGAIPENLLESELFGHEKGAFTGATERHIGAFEEASDGTVFLDEIGELPANLQPKLLRVLESKEIRRVGSNVRKEVDVRIIAATNRDLRAEVNAGRFRSDLYFRLAVLRVTLPPLRERAEDIPELLEHFLSMANPAAGELEWLRAPELVSKLQSLSWAGNVRELRNYLERCAIFGSAPAPLEGPMKGSTVQSEVDLSIPLSSARERAVVAFERHYLDALMKSHDWRVGKAAEQAGIDRISLWRLLRRHGIKNP